MASDTELITAWKKKKDYGAYQTLKSRHKNMVYQTANMYRAASIPQQALEIKAWELFDEAVNGYNPTKGAKFSTYLNYQLRKLDRYTKRYQNIARIPEAISLRIGDYDRANEQLQREFGRVPTVGELSNKLDMPTRHIRQMQKSRRGDLYEGKFEQADIVERTQKTDWLLKELRDELTPQEQQVYDYLIGYKKKKITNKKELAVKLGMSPGRISQITRSIATKIGPHLKRNL